MKAAVSVDLYLLPGRYQGDVAVLGALAAKGAISLSLFLLLSTFIVPAAHAEQSADSMELGKKVFVEISQPQCAVCHSLSDAGATGNVGPKLDELKPTKEQVITAVTEGIEAMPGYSDSLTKGQIEAVAEYVAEVSGKP